MNTSPVADEARRFVEGDPGLVHDIDVTELDGLPWESLGRHEPLKWAARIEGFDDERRRFREAAPEQGEQGLFVALMVGAVEVGFADHELVV